MGKWQMSLGYGDIFKCCLHCYSGKLHKAGGVHRKSDLSSHFCSRIIVQGSLFDEIESDYSSKSERSSWK